MNQLLQQRSDRGFESNDPGESSSFAGHSKLALLCSQKCPGDLILKTYDFARAVRHAKPTVVSGFHSPIEKDCLPILLRGSALIIIVQAHRLSTRLPAEWRKAIDAGRLRLLSPFSEKDKRITRELAIARNRFVAEMCDEVLIPYAHPGSNTEALALDLLQNGKPVLTFESRSNEKLIAAGAKVITPEYFTIKAAGANRGGRTTDPLCKDPFQ